MYRHDHIMESELIEKYFYHLASFDPVLGEINKYKEIHAGGTRYENNDKELVLPNVQQRFTVELKNDDLRNCNLEVFCMNLYKFTNERIEKVNREIFNTVNQITNLTGNLVDTKGKQISSELLLEILEKIYIPFDEEGKPILPSLFVSPNLATQIIKLEETKKDKEKFQNILEKKKKDFYAKKRYRRLSSID